MSLLRTERLAIALCPGQVGVVRLAGWPRAKIVGKEVLPADGDGWAAAIEALDHWLETAKARRLSATVVLSNHFARFAWLPWSGDLDGEERQALIAARFRELYGDMSGWTFSVDPGRYGQPALAVAVEAALIEALRHRFESRRIACRRLQPYFVAGWNRWRRRVDAEPALFAVAESGTMVVGALAGVKAQRHWQGLHALLGAYDAAALPALLARESLLQGFADVPACYVVAPALKGELAAPLRLLEAQDEVSAIAMALCGASS